jgi:dihydrofolate reductase
VLLHATLGSIPIKPNIAAIAAMTIDGKIARNANHFPDWTSPEDKTFFQSMLTKYDVMVMGHNTYKTAEQPLSKRNCIIFTRSVQDIERRGANLLYYNAAGPTSIESILEQYRSVAVLGGARIYSYFLERDLIDDLYLTLEPIVFGSGIDLFHHESAATKRLHLAGVKQLNPEGTVLLHYQRSSAHAQPDPK